MLPCFLDSWYGGGFLDATIHSSYRQLSLTGTRIIFLVLLSLFVLLRTFGQIINYINEHTLDIT